MTDKLAPEATKDIALNGSTGAPATRWVEEGTAFADLHGRTASDDAETFDVIVIGGGQAGLSVGYELAQRNLRFIILDAQARIGDVWRQRWDSLHLFTPARYSQLAGMAFPGSADRFPAKDEMADYLESYASALRLPIRSACRVERLTREGHRYVVIAGGRRLEANHVVIAMANYQEPRVPEFGAQLDSAIRQIHSLDYRRPSQLPEGDVLLVGAGNSGAEIAMDLVRDGRKVWLSGRETGEVPFDTRQPWVRRFVLPVVFRVLFHRLFSFATPLGERMRPMFVSRGGPLIRTRKRDLAAAGVKRVGRMSGVVNGKPQLDDGTVLDVASVVWCTGFRIGSQWVALPVFDEHHEPIQTRGVATGEPGLYFVGQHFLYAASSSMIHGVGRDARHVAGVIASRVRAESRAAAPELSTSGVAGR